MSKETASCLHATRSLSRPTDIVVPRLWDYKQYLDRRYHDEFDPWARSFKDPWSEELDQERPLNNRSGVASMGAPLNWDSQLRLDYLDAQGIAAEVLFPNTVPPFYPSGVLTAPGPRSPREYELRFAGLRAHNRWLADFCDQAPDRRAGFAQIFLDDVDDAIAEVRWAKEAGLRGVLLPGDHVLKMANLYYPRYEPLWATCAELDLPIHRHAAAPTESFYEGGKASQLVAFVEIQFYTARAVSHLIFSGVFERHPELKFVTTEIAGASELARDLAQMDMMAGLRDMGTGTPFYAHVKDALEELTRASERLLRVQLLCGRTARSPSGEGNGHPESDVGSRHTPFGGNRSLHPRSASHLSLGPSRSRVGHAAGEYRCEGVRLSSGPAPTRGGPCRAYGR